MRAELPLASRLLACILLLLASLPGPASAGEYAPPYPILDADDPVSLGFYVAWHEDRDGDLTFGQASRLPQQLFTVSERESLHFGYSRSAWWFRVALQNTLDTDVSLLLEVPHPTLGHVEFYRPAPDGSYGVVHAGTGSHRVIGDFAHNTFLFTVDIPRGTTRTLWFRVQSDLAVDFSLNAQSPEAFAMKRDRGRMLTGVFLGVLLSIATLIAIVRTRGSRTPHTWYLLTLFSIVLFLFTREGYIGVLLLRQPGLQPLLESAAAVAATITGLQFARAFLETRIRLPAIDRALAYLFIAGTGCLVAIPWVNAALLGPAYTSLAALAMAATLLAATMAWRAGCRDAPAYITARLVSGIVGGLIVFGDWGILPRLPASGTLLIAAATVEGLLIARLLFRRGQRARANAYAEGIRAATTSAGQHARADLLDRFSHDARAPLTGILGMTELLGDTTLTPRQREYMLTIRSAGENLLTLLNDTLDWSRLDTGQADIQHGDFDLAQLVADSLETVQLRAEEKHIELLVDIDRSLPAHVTGDAARLRQVLCNLLGNAVRLTNRGEVQVHVMPTGQPHIVRIEVRDTGVGIPREKLATLFDRNAPGGSANQGLGLVIARQLVERMGGRIGATSEERRGSTFWITLPLPEARVHESVTADTGILDGKRLLAVDDNAAVRRILQTQATQWGMQVTVADNGQEALAMARSQANLGEPFDAVIVDHNMPGMSGLQLAARIKEDPLIRNDAIIVMLTGLNIAPTDTMARDVGIRRVLTKPVAGRTLQAALAEEFTRRESFEPPNDAARPLPARMRVLVVEDNAMSQKVIRGMLAKLGVGSDTASNGQEAVDAVQHHRYDLVLMDCEMPVINGYEATRRIRAWERDHGRRHTPVIALSAHILQEIKERCREAGMDAHMAKPLDLNELRATLSLYAGK